MIRKNLLGLAAIGFALYLISAGLSYGIFSYILSGGKAVPSLTTGGSTTPAQGFRIDPSLPKTESCPLNGAFFTRQEKDIWEKRRPLAVMIENHEESRPQSGLSNADIVYEAVAEGGITRFMGVFYCGAAASDVTVAPVRSARTFFLPWVLEYDALYNHVGGAGRCSDPTVDERAKALCQIEQWKIKDMDQFGISFPTCYRNYDRLDHPVATEHTMVCFTDKLYKLASERGWTDTDAKGVSWNTAFEPWKFKDDAPTTERTASFSASFSFWSGYEASYGVRWDYDQATNTYARTNGNAAHLDLETKEQLRAKVVVILFAKETGPVDEHKHLLYANVGEGDALVMQDGKVVKAKWKKPARTSRTKWYDATGKEISLNRGQIWIEMVPIGTIIRY